MNASWVFVDSGYCSGRFNMEYDESLAVTLLETGGVGTLRFYRWRPWAVSLGYHQHEADVDHERCFADGIEVVRRPTGGRAILHAEELTYSVVMTVDGRGVLEVYSDISRALICGLKLFGVDAEYQRPQLGSPTNPRFSPSVPCFSSSARYEIGWKGRKLVGSAQRRYCSDDRVVILQHGSILCGPAHLNLTEYLKVKEPEMQTRIRKELEAKTVCLQELAGGAVDGDSLVESLRRGFEITWGIAFSPQSVPFQMREPYA